MTTISLKLDQLLQAIQNTYGVGLKYTTAPTSVSDKGWIYSKYISGVNELFYVDGYNSTTQITKNGSLLVTKIQDKAVSSFAPTDGQVLAWNNSASIWTPQTQDAYLIQTRSVSSFAPTDGQVLAWNNSASKWTPQTQDAYLIQTRSVSNSAPTDGYAIVWNTSQNKYISSATLDSIKMGVVPTGIANDKGIATTSTSEALSLWGIRSSGSGNVSTVVVADVNSATIDPNHKVLQIGWVNNSDTFTELYNFKDSELNINSIAAAKILSTEADGGSTIAVTIGSDNKFSTSGAKLLSIQNGTTDGYERGNIDYAGNFCINKGDNAQCLGVKYLTEVYAVPASVDGYSVNQLPAQALIIGINARVTKSVAGTTTFSLGVSGTYNYFGSGIASTVGTTQVCMTNGIFYNAAARSVLIKPNTTPSDALGTIRLTIYYISMTVPTS
jgi:hypothetical protein